MTDDTIFALSSGAPPAAIAVIRISGQQALRVAEAISGPLPVARMAALRRLREPGGGLLDRALILCFPGPRSATGEDLVELHLHGGRAVVRGVEAALETAGLRRAVAGEFTRRALANGRIDLAEAEGLADLLTAETEEQRRVALASAEGAVSRAVAGWRDRVLALSATVEAQLDFADEADVGDVAARSVLGLVAVLRDDMAAVLRRPTVERLRDGVRVVLAGPPNSGKSTLFNLLGQREAAIVSPVAGTTRDAIEVPVARAGVPYVLTDTAGLVRDGADPIEAIGVTRADAAIGAADLVLWLGDSPAPETNAAVILVHPRADLPGRCRAEGRIAVSCGDARSVEILWEAIAAATRPMLPIAGTVAFNARQHRLCLEAAAALTDMPEGDWLLIAERLRWCRTALLDLLGQGTTELMLDALFGRFCIGK